MNRFLTDLEKASALIYKLIQRQRRIFFAFFNIKPYY